MSAHDVPPVLQDHVGPTPSEEKRAPDEVPVDESSDGGDGPEWHDTRLCGRCQSLRSYIGFRSHCRVCGKSVCHACTAPSAPAAWLEVPFVRLCRNIPPTHRRTMRCCTECAQKAALDELDYVWVRVMNRAEAGDVESSKAWCEAGSARTEDAEKYLRGKAEEIKQVLVVVGRGEFACTGFAHDATAHRTVELDAHTLHTFDLVYNTQKLWRATASAVMDVPITGTMFVTLLSRPITCPAVLQIIKKLAFVATLPSVYSLAHPDNAAACLSAMNAQQLLCLYLHRPADLDVAKTILASARSVADAHLDTVAKLAAIASERDHAQRVALVHALGKPNVLVRGDYCVIQSIGFSCSEALELTCSHSNKGQFKVFLLTGVEPGIINAAAFLQWVRTSHVFQSMTVLPDGRACLLVPCSTRMHDALRPTHVYAVGQAAPAGGAAISVPDAPDRDAAEVAAAMQTILPFADCKSVLTQCVALTLQQTAEGKTLDMSTLRFFLDANDCMLVYRTCVSRAEAPPAEEQSVEPRPCWSNRPLTETSMEKVRADSAKLMTDNREFVFWLMVLATGKRFTQPWDPQTILPFSF